MVLIGIAFVLLWLMVTVFTIELLKAALVVGIIYIVAGLLLGDRPWNNRT